jgi:predicted HAD superfamily Cof-like phosphohydrolase
MSENHRDVGQFHEKFNLDNTTARPVGPRDVPRELFDFRLKFMREELREFEEGEAEGDLAKMADSLIDLVYVVLGTAHVYGFPWQALWDEVQRANMAKERTLRVEDSARGSTYDVIKPAGWQPPDIVGVLRAHGWKI